MTNPHAVAGMAWWPWLFPTSNQDQEEDQEEDVGLLLMAAEEDKEGESPCLIEAEGDELGDSPVLDSERVTWACCCCSSSGGVVEVLPPLLLLLLLLFSTALLFFFGRGGNCFLLFAIELFSSRVGELPAEAGCVKPRFECRFEFICTNGGSPLIIPGQGIATETSLHGKCS